MDLIDRRALDFSFDRRCFSECDEQYVRGVDDAINVVTNAPTISVEHVVYCRECKHGRESKSSFDWDGKTPLCECPYMMLTHRWYEYCSFGERKEPDQRCREWERIGEHK